MDETSNIILLDPDTRRRAVISHALSAGGLHVEPFETMEELASSWPRAGYILADADTFPIDTLVQRMAMDGEWFPIIAFGEELAPQRIVEIVVEGAIDVIAWPFTARDLIETLKRAQLRVQTVGSMQMRKTMALSRIERLTGREREVLDGVASGLSNRMIAQQLAISPRTVEIHRANMLSKLGASHSSEAIRVAIEASMIP
ncbi:MAG: LuxR C-terminal-related transcriptional regulator [Sphingomonadaceae bacterium]|jgi:FixJ family two-component response regulator